jgi:hypothetical protein
LSCCEDQCLDDLLRGGLDRAADVDGTVWGDRDPAAGVRNLRAGVRAAPNERSGIVELQQDNVELGRACRPGRRPRDIDAPVRRDGDAVAACRAKMRCKARVPSGVNLRTKSL